jgi:hypothetical protein
MQSELTDSKAAPLASRLARRAELDPMGRSAVAYRLSRGRLLPRPSITIPTEEVFAAIKRDLQQLRSYLKDAAI